MRKKANERVTYTIACKCGGKLKVDGRAFGHPQVCRKCGNTVAVEWGKDARTYKKVPIARTMVTKRGGIRPDQTPYVALCGCGYKRPAPPSEIGKSPVCPGCGKLMNIEKLAHLNDPNALPPVEVPTQPFLPMAERPPITMEIISGTESFECPCGLRLLIRTGAIGRQMSCPECERKIILEEIDHPALAPANPLPIPGKAKKPARTPGPGETVCDCGNFIPPRTSRTGPSFTCSSCGRQGKVEQVTDPQTGLSTVKAVITGGAPKPPEPPYENAEFFEPAPPE